MPVEFRDLRGGDEFEPVHINSVYRLLRKWLKFKVTHPLKLDGWDSADGVPHLAVVGWDNRYICKAIGAIPAMSGTAMGAGTVRFQRNDGSGNLVDAQINDQAAWNPSKTTMTSGNGIDDGMFCAAWKDIYGDWYVAPLECA